MTACVNRKHTKKVAAVVTASLVGALSLGVAPVAAMATNEGISTQSTSEVAAWENGTVTYAKDNDGYIIKNPEGYEFEKDGRAHHILPLVVMPENATNPVSVDEGKVSYQVWDTSTNTWRNVAKESMTEIAKYRAVIPGSAILSPTGTDYRGTLYMEFSIVGKSLQGSTIFNAAEDGTANGTFTYTGVAQDFGFVVNGYRYDYDAATGTFKNIFGKKNFDVEWWNTNTNKKLPAGTLPTDAGNYTAVLVGTGDYSGSEAKINFTINKLDLASADIVLSDMPYATAVAGMGMPKVAFVNGKAMSTDGSMGAPKNLVISWAGEEPDIIRDHNTYQMNVSAISGNKNVTGSKVVSFKVVDKVINDTDFTYKGARLNGSTIEVTRTVTRTYFDYTKIRCTDADAMKQAIVTITDEAGNKVKPEDVNSKVGTYTLTISFAADNYTYGLNAPVSMTIKVMNDDLWTSADLTYTWEGNVVEGAIHPTYDGEDVLPEIGTVVKSSNGTKLVEGTDYDVVVTDINGNTVDKIVDAGTYFVNVVSDTYKILRGGDPSGTTLVVHVQPKYMSNLYIDSDQVKDFGKDGSFIPYTGTDATYFFYTIVDGKEVRLPEGVIEVDHFNFDDDFTNLEGINYWTPGAWEKVDWEDVDAINAVGQYVPSVKVVNDNYLYIPDITMRKDGVVNKIDVRGESVYSDLDASEWGAEEIYKAHDLGYMGGYNGTSIFGKDDSIKRGDVATVLYNMAGSPEAPTEGEIKDGGYKTKFDDVDPYMYYAKAIAWANACGIISGDSGTANFRPEDPVSRQELAKMLAEYARVTGDEISADTSVLDDYKDGDEVSEWAEEYVAWAVENGIMGVDTDQLWATGRITRRHVAIMVVRYQPDGKLHDAMIPSWPR